MKYLLIIMKSFAVVKITEFKYCGWHLQLVPIESVLYKNIYLFLNKMALARVSNFIVLQIDFAAHSSTLGARGWREP